MSDHIAGEDLAAYVDGALADGRKAELESHFSRCPECLEALAEIVDIQSGRVKIPGEFLRQALGDKQAARKPALPMHLVFEIAAAFLVVVVIGYFYLGGNRFWQAGRPQKEGEVATAGNSISQVPSEAGRIAPIPAGRVEPAQEAKTKKVAVEKNAMTAPVPVPPPGGGTVPAAAPKDRRSNAVEEKEMPELEQKLEEAAAQPLQSEVDKLDDAQVVYSRSAEMAATAQPTLAAQSRGAQPAGKEKAGAMPATRYEEYKMGATEPVRSRSAQMAGVDGALQLFLAATGRAAAPLGIEMAVPAPSRFRIAGGVVWTDLRDPGLLDGWSWFKKGMILELELDSAGLVTAVIPVGRWEPSAVDRAEKAARQLTFSVSEKKTRRARISVSGSQPN